ncbi:MAG: hypothetical protein AAFO04_22090 [Cyanobacteria bacterium J06592_8]
MAKLGEILVRKPLISESQLKQALMFQASYSQQLGRILVEQGLISEHCLEQALREQDWRRNGYWVID